MDALALASYHHGSAPGLFQGEQGWTFAQWHQEADGVVDRISAGLVTTEACSTLDLAAVLWGAFRAGATLVLLPPGVPEERTQQLLAGLGNPPQWDEQGPKVLGLTAGVVLFTSGSTGVPEAVVHTPHTLMAAAQASNQNLPFGPGDRWAVPLSLHHVGGLAVLFRALAGGGAVQLPDRGGHWSTALRQGVSHVSLVTAQLVTLLQRQIPLPENVLVGGGPLSTVHLDQARRRGARVFATYGCTEMGSQITTTSMGELQGAGAPLSGVELEIDSDGEILVRGPQLCRGKLLAGELVSVVDGDGWYHTGDLGQMNDGCLEVRGRKDSAFTSRGERVVPQEIERKIMAYHGVIEAVVVGVPSPKWGQVPVAFVDGAAAAQVLNWLRDRLPTYMIPDKVLQIPDVTPGYPGKRPRPWLRQRAIDTLKSQ